MTIDQFADLTRTRIPTPAEFLSFVNGQGWTIRKGSNGSAALGVRGEPDHLARALAKMLSREPWRTEVLRLIPESPVRPAEPPPPPVRLPPVAAAVPPAPDVAATEDQPAVVEDRRTVREGVCVARVDGWLAWATYRAGETYRFAEYRVKHQGEHVPSIEVFAASSSGFVGPDKFAEMFEVCQA